MDLISELDVPLIQTWLHVNWLMLNQVEGAKFFCDVAFRFDVHNVKA